jgi:hypothetical protein
MPPSVEGVCLCRPPSEAHGYRDRAPAARVALRQEGHVAVHNRDIGR